MNKLIKTLWVVIICMSSISTHADELSIEKRKDIEQLLTMTGALSLAKQIAMNFAQNAKNSLSESRPDIPAEVINQLPVIIGGVFDENTEALKNMYVPLYHKYFTASEVKEMIVFYASPLGQKTIKVMPALFQDSLKLGQIWGESVAPQVEKRIRENLMKKGIQI